MRKRSVVIIVLTIFAVAIVSVVLMRNAWSEYSTTEKENLTWYDDFPMSLDNVREFVSLQMIGTPEYCGFTYVPLEYVEGHFRYSEQESTNSSPQPINPVYTFYGMVLSEMVGLEYNKQGVIRFVNDSLLPRIVKEDDYKRFNYSVDAYFMCLIMRHLNTELSRSDERVLIQNLEKLLLGLDLQSEDAVYNNLYTIQFALEISRMCDRELSEECISHLREYIDSVIDKELIVNTVSVSDINLICDIIPTNSVSKLQEQTANSSESLFLNGGYRRAPGLPPDVISTYKFLRVLPCRDGNELQEYVKGFAKNGVMTMNDTVQDMDLRFLYCFVRLWNVSKGD